MGVASPPLPPGTPGVGPGTRLGPSTRPSTCSPPAPPRAAPGFTDLCAPAAPVVRPRSPGERPCSSYGVDLPVPTLLISTVLGKINNPNMSALRRRYSKPGSSSGAQGWASPPLRPQRGFCVCFEIMRAQVSVYALRKKGARKSRPRRRPTWPVGVVEEGAPGTQGPPDPSGCGSPGSGLHCAGGSS